MSETAGVGIAPGFGDELTRLTIREAADAISRGDVSPMDLVRAYLARIEVLDPRLGAYITVTTERALSDARRATDELAVGQRRGPLHGIPLGLKDLIDTAGIRAPR